MSPLRLVVLLSAAAAALAAAGRLWLTALTPGAAPYIARVEPDRSVWDREAAIRVAPKLSVLLRPPRQAAPTRRHSVARHRVHARRTVGVSYHPSPTPTVQYASRTIPATRPQAPKTTPRRHGPSTSPAPKPTPKPRPAPKPTPAPAPSPSPSPAPAPQPQQPTAGAVTTSQTTTTPAPEPATSSPPTGPIAAPPPPPVTPPTVDPPIETRPGHGYGDPNHTHTGPPGQSPEKN